MRDARSTGLIWSIRLRGFSRRARKRGAPRVHERALCQLLPLLLYHIYNIEPTHHVVCGGSIWRSGPGRYHPVITLITLGKADDGENINREEFLQVILTEFFLEHPVSTIPCQHGAGRSPRPEGTTWSTTYFRWAWPTACGFACGWTRRVRAMPLAGAAACYRAVASAA